MTEKVLARTNQKDEHRRSIDKHVGERIRLRRTSLGLSAASLAKSLNIRYQQLHFYERGKCQITSSGLHILSNILNVPVSFFFDAIPDEVSINNTSSENLAKACLQELNVFSVRDIKTVEEEVRNLSGCFYKIEDPATRKGIIAFLKLIGRRQQTTP